MRRQVLFSVIAAVAVLLVLPLAATMGQQQKDEFMKIVDAGVKALNAKDIAAFEAIHLQDETSVHVDIMGGMNDGVYKGWAASKVSFQEFMKTPSMLTKVQNVSLKVVGDTAWGVWTMVNEMTMEGKKTENPFRLTLVFQRVGGKWLVAHSHASAAVPPPPPAPKQ